MTVLYIYLRNTLYDMIRRHEQHECVHISKYVMPQDIRLSWFVFIWAPISDVGDSKDNSIKTKRIHLLMAVLFNREFPLSTA